MQLQKPAVADEAGVDTLEAYFDKYPAAAERIHRRGGQTTVMPNLQFRTDEVARIIAFLKYTSQMDTEGWPPVPQVAGLTFPQATKMPTAAVAVAAPPKGSDDPVTRGARLVEDNGCSACHSAGNEVLVGPAWGQLYGSDVMLADGTRATVDDAFLTRAILDPDVQIAAGFDKGVMPPYANLLETEQVAAIVAYIRSLGGEDQ
ncbi:cytochrome c [Hoeflea sp.]|uniref:c-type cytochrome n=1 Tax=Hoeflea sp. TaxID=1940281 RepID=UPI0025C2FA5B|nr:cytochrome c [Hoeflea sp.]